jgi:hypothetical protein
LGELFTPDLEDVTPGSLNDEFVIRGLITTAIKNCSKSRQQIAEEMTNLLGATVTKRALDSYTSEAADLNRWPAQYTRAFCYVTNDWSLIRCVSERCGLHVITKAERKLLELGRQTLIQERAAAAIARLKSELAEVQL